MILKFLYVQYYSKILPFKFIEHLMNDKKYTNFYKT